MLLMSDIADFKLGQGSPMPKDYAKRLAKALQRLGGRRVRPVEQSFYDSRIDIPTECFADTFIPAKLLDHPVERGRKLTDLVFCGDADRLIEVTGFDFSGAFQQPSYRTGDATADKESEAQAKRCRKTCDNS